MVRAARVTWQRQVVDGAGRTALEAVLDLACRQQAALMHLADVDEHAHGATVT